MKIKPFSIMLRGKKYKILHLPPSKMRDSESDKLNLRILGECTSPMEPERTIKIDNTINGKELLTLYCHELSHSLNYSLLESAVDEMSNDLANALWRLGYRNIYEKN